MDDSTYECTFRKYGRLGFSLSEDCEVTMVSNDSQAESFGQIAVGDRLHSISGRMVRGYKDAEKRLTKAGRPLLLKFERAVDFSQDVLEGKDAYSCTFRIAGPLGFTLTPDCRIEAVARGGQSENLGVIAIDDKLDTIDGIKVVNYATADHLLRVNNKRPIVLQFSKGKGTEHTRRAAKPKVKETAVDLLDFETFNPDGPSSGQNAENWSANFVSADQDGFDPNRAAPQKTNSYCGVADQSQIPPTGLQQHGSWTPVMSAAMQDMSSAPCMSGMASGPYTQQCFGAGGPALAAFGTQAAPQAQGYAALMRPPQGVSAGNWQQQQQMQMQQQQMQMQQQQQMMMQQQMMQGQGMCGGYGGHQYQMPPQQAAPAPAPAPVNPTEVAAQFDPFA